MSASIESNFKTKREETTYGFNLIMDIVLAAKNGNPYKEEIKEMWDIAGRNADVKQMVRELLMSLARTNSKE